MQKRIRRVGLALLTITLAQPWAIGAEPPAGEAVEDLDSISIPGFTKTERGGRIVFCKTDQKIGTRFKTEKCIDSEHARAYLAALEDNKRELESLRSALNRIM